MKSSKKIDLVKIIELPKIKDPRGNLSFFEDNSYIPFKIERAYWIYDVPGGEIRGGHAFKQQHEFIIALSGSFEVVVDDGKIQKVFMLNRSYYGLYIPNGLWRQMRHFSTNALALVVSNKKYDETDYLRDYDKFVTNEFDNESK